MARLEVSGDGAVQGRAATSGARVELLSVHLQGNAKFACALRFLGEERVAKPNPNP